MSNENIERKRLVRDLKRAALTRMEDAARTSADFRAIQKQWDKLDENRERRERYHEVKRNEQTLLSGYSGGHVFPIPISHPSWREAMRGDFHDLIYDNAEDLWQLVEDLEIARLLKALKSKQKDVLFLSAVRASTPQQIACYRDKTDRAVRKLLTATLVGLREKLAPIIREQIEIDSPDMTFAKRQFLERYDNKALDNDEDNRYNGNLLQEIKGYVSDFVNSALGGTK